MRKHLFHYGPRVGTLLLAALLARSAAAQQGCEFFKNIAHCPIGQAELQLAPDGSELTATQLGPAGADGVSSEFDMASHWRAETAIVGPADVMTFRALLDGAVTAAARLQSQPQGLELRTTFTGAAGAHTYRVIVLSAGEVVGDFGGYDENSVVIIRPPIPEPIPWPDWPPWPPRPDFSRRLDGSCTWGLDFGTSLSFTTSDGNGAVGDTVRLVEDVSGAGHYPYAGFNAITLQTNGSSLVFTDEQISGN